MEENPCQYQGKCLSNHRCAFATVKEIHAVFVVNGINEATTARRSKISIVSRGCKTAVQFTRSDKILAILVGYRFESTPSTLQCMNPVPHARFLSRLRRPGAESQTMKFLSVWCSIVDKDNNDYPLQKNNNRPSRSGPPIRNICNE